MMELPHFVSPYNFLLREVSQELFKPTTSQSEGLAALQAYVQAPYTYGSIKPLKQTWRYKQHVRYGYAPLVEALEKLHGTQEIQQTTSLSLDDVVGIAYEQCTDFLQRAVLLLAHEFGFYTITEQANREHLINSDTKSSIVQLVIIMGAANTPASKVMDYVLPPLFKEEPLLSEPFIFESVYTTGIAAVLEGRVSDLTIFIKENKQRLRGTTYKDHIALSLLGAHAHNARLIPQAIAFYEKSLKATPPEETQESIYRHSVTALFALYCLSPAFTTKITALYLKAKAAGIILNEEIICERVAFVTDKTITSYLTSPTEQDLQRLDTLLPLANVPLVHSSLTTAYNSIMIQASQSKNTKHAVHCLDKLAELNQDFSSEITRLLLLAKSCAPENIPLLTIINKTKLGFEKVSKKRFNTEDYTGALASLHAAQELGASNKWLTWKIGRCYEATGNYAAARIAYEQLPDFKNAQIGLKRLTELFENQGIAFFNQGNYEAAFSSLCIAEDLGASGDWLTWRISRCYEAAGDMTSARKMYASLPDFKNAQIGLRRLAKRAPAKE